MPLFFQSLRQPRRQVLVPVPASYAYWHWQLLIKWIDLSSSVQYLQDELYGQQSFPISRLTNNNKSSSRYVLVKALVYCFPIASGFEVRFVGQFKFSYAREG